MKNITFIKSHFLVAIALLTAGVTMSFKMADSKPLATTHYYVSEDMSEGAFKNTANWNTVNSDGVNCGTVQIRPCKITVATGSSLGSVLGSKTNSQVLGISEGFKPNP